MTDTTFTVADLENRLVLLDAKIAKAEASVVRAQRELDELRVQRTGAAAFIALLTEPVPTAKAKTANGGVTNVVHEIFTEHPEGVANAEIQRIARERGHDFDSDQIRSSVTYLSRRGDIENTGTRGVWRLKNVATPNENGSVVTEPFPAVLTSVESGVRAG